MRKYTLQLLVNNTKMLNVGDFAYFTRIGTALLPCVSFLNLPFVGNV